MRLSLFRRTSNRNTSASPLPSPATRLVAALSKTIRRPSPEIDGQPLYPSGSPPFAATDSRVVIPSWRSRRYTSQRGLPRLAPPGYMFQARLLKATQRPSSEIAGHVLSSRASIPFQARLTRSTAPVARSRTKTSVSPLVSPGTRSLASLWKARKRPSADSAGPAELPWISPPSAPTLARATRPGILCERRGGRQEERDDQRRAGGPAARRRLDRSSHRARLRSRSLGDHCTRATRRPLRVLPIAAVPRSLRLMPVGGTSTPQQAPLLVSCS